MIDKQLETDVLVVGGGGGGLRAAIEAHAAGARVLVVSKGIVGKSGLTQTAVTGFQVALGNVDARDNPSVHFEDSMRGSYGLADPELVRIFTSEAPQAVEDIESFGARFDRDENGKLFQRTLDSSQTYPRSIKKGDALGTPIMQALRKQTRKCAFPIRHEILVTKLLKSGDRVCGVIGIDFQTGEIIHIAAKTIIMATGGGGELYPVNSNTPDATGNGAVLALEAGADLVDMEFILMLGHAVLHPQTVRGVLFTFQYLLPKGARLPFNGLDEAFLANYDPDGADNPPRHIYARAIHGEVRAGRGSPHGGVYFDPSTVSRETLVSTLPSQTEFLETLGVDMTQPIEVGVAAHYFCGGIKINPNAQSTVPGLYAVGECSGGPHGAARVGGNSLTEVLVFGKRAGRHAAEAAAGMSFAPADQVEIDAECGRLLGFLDNPGEGPRPTDLIHRLKDTMGEHVGVVRSDGGLRQALSDIEDIASNGLPAMSLATSGRVANYDWIQAVEISSMAVLAEIVARACLERTESRGAHYREDHADMKDGEWMRNILIRRQDGTLSLSSKPVGAALELEQG
jgi:succinate dehydrogenase/fumarate reductase flavoprotein subunit